MNVCNIHNKNSKSEENRTRQKRHCQCQSNAILTWKNQRMSPERFNAWKASDCNIYIYFLLYKGKLYLSR